MLRALSVLLQIHNLMLYPRHPEIGFFHRLFLLLDNALQVFQFGVETLEDFLLLLEFGVEAFVGALSYSEKNIRVCERQSSRVWGWEDGRLRTTA